METEKRLIDANDALERLKKAEKEMKVVSLYGFKAVPMDGVIDFVASRPTVDAVEVVHGRWIEGEMVIDDGVGGHIYHCSECDDWYHAFTPNYCPNCGAKMDGVQE